MGDFYVEIGISCLPKYTEELCGDTVRTTATEASVVGVVSDGLGSGVKASILSTLTTSIAARMFTSGVSLEDMMETIGATLPLCRERKIAYATLTALEIRRTGQAYLAEFDAPEALLLRGGQPVVLERTPRRVRGGTWTVNEAHFWMQEDDYLVCVTDGVIHAGIGAKLALGLGETGLRNYLEQELTPQMEAQTVADRILDYVHFLYDGRPGDDATALVLRTRKPRRLMVLVGPPKDPALDPVLARKLAAFSGKKVICGGTTATLVARELERPLTIDLEQFPVDHPPSGQIPGIDLVTEGIITLCTTAEMLTDQRDRYQENSPAGQLSQLLLESDYIDFHVGGAINPAHQNPDLPFDLALKQQVVNKIAAALKEKGKRVQLQFY